MSTTARYHQLTTQRAYARRIAAFGLPALLAPYTLRTYPIPAQRRRSVITERIGA